MATIKDIAKAIVERHKMKMGASEEFLQTMVEVINDGLLSDRIVKIKGFGTFKLQEVKERKSVNVNTGESLIIAAHDRITFTPDSVMRDLVNKPFAQFETVVVDSVQKTEEPKVEEPAKESDASSEPEPAVVEEQKPVEKTAEEASEEEAPTPVEKVAEQPKTEKEPQKEQPKKEEPKKVEPKKDEPVVVEEPVEEEPSSNRKWLYIIVGVVVAAACFVLGYLASHNDMFNKSEAPATDKTEQVQKKDSVSVVDSTAVETVKSETKEDDFEKYNKDGRVKYGAYMIIGTDTTVTVRKGQTLKGISKAYLGPDMECYVEAYNDTKEVKEGDKVLIPKLKAKKRKK